MKMRRAIGLLAVLATVPWSWGCANLDVTNPNEPDRARSLGTPNDVETLVAGTFLLWWQVNKGLGTSAETRPAAAVGALAAMGEEATASGAHYGMQDHGRRPIQPQINDPGHSWHPYIESTWQEFYKVISATRDGLLALQDPEFQVGDNGADNERLETFAKFMQGMAHASLGYIYKEAYILDETVPDDQLASLELRPYEEVMDAGLSYLEEAANQASSRNFTIPASWMGGISHSSAELAQIANSYRARFMAGVGRTPADRAAVDWQEVLNLAQAGITTDFGVEADGPGGIWRAQIWQAHGATSTSGGGRRIHNEIVGPADQTGQWQIWHFQDPFTERNYFTLETPDRRVNGAGGPETAGTLVSWWSSSGMAASRGLYYWSHYADQKFVDYRETNYGFLPDISVRELNYLMAEAYINLGQPQAAADLINIQRVGNGQLPPVTPAGAPEVNGECVPRTATGECGSLMDALKYDKGLELWLEGMGVRFTDRRGWGDLPQGEALHFPVPKNELSLAGKDFYTTGGIGGIDAFSGGDGHF